MSTSKLPIVKMSTSKLSQNVDLLMYPNLIYLVYCWPQSTSPQTKPKFVNIWL
jgi:hypothetical protein